MQPAGRLTTDELDRSSTTAKRLGRTLRPTTAARPTEVWRDVLLRRLLALADLLAALTASLSLGFVVGGSGGQLVRALVFLPVWIVTAKLCGLYDRDQRVLRHLTVDEAPKLLLAALTTTFALAAFVALTGGPSLTLGDVTRVALIAAALALVLRAAARYAWRRATPPQRIAIVGDGSLADAMRRKLELFADIHAEVGYETPELHTDQLEADAPSWLDGIDRIIVAASTIDDVTIRRLVELGRRRGVRVSVVPPVAGMFGTAVRLNHVAELPLVEYNTWDVSRSTLLLKRVLDVALSTVLLVVLAPLMLAIAVAVKATSRGPVLFGQLRAGLDGRPFRMLKFRTMVADAEERLADLVCIESLEHPVFKLEGDPRVTRVGRLLRRWSLDELPQLVNVLRGDMSLVGPRPEQLELVERYRPEHRFRLDAKPGLTGPMQVYGRGALRFDERLAVEREYIENLSLGRDVRLLALTLAAVVRGRGAH